jgi:hypothetical protein
MRIRMLKTRNWTVPSDRRVTIQYREGKGYPIKRAWGELFVAEGDAVEVATPARPAPTAKPARIRKPRARRSKASA